jgi:hypothetical protein
MEEISQLSKGHYPEVNLSAMFWHRLAERVIEYKRIQMELELSCKKASEEIIKLSIALKSFRKIPRIIKYRSF